MPTWSAAEPAPHRVDIGGYAIRRDAPADGRDAVLPVPEDIRVACGGPEPRALFATGAGAGAGRPAVELADMPLSGALLAVEVEVPGVAAILFDPEVSAS